MIAASKQYEQSWRHLTQRDSKKLAKLLLFLKDNKSLFPAISRMTGMDPELWGRVTMGIYHYPEIQEPSELEYKIHLN